MMNTIFKKGEMNMFKKKVTFEEFEEFKNVTKLRIEQLEEQIDLLLKSQNKNRKTKVNVKPPTQKSPQPFFMKVLEHLYESDDVRYFEGKFIDENDEVIAERFGDVPLKVTQPFISSMFVELFPPLKRVERGFYHRAAQNGVLHKNPNNPRGDYYLTTMAQNSGSPVGALIITNEFLEKYLYKSKV